MVACAELQFNLNVTTAHLPGASNILADQGSRAWSGQPLIDWSNAMLGWNEQVVPSAYRKIYKSSSSNYSDAPSQTRRGASTSQRGVNGVDSTSGSTSPSGSPPTASRPNPYSLLCSRLTAGALTAP